MTKHIYIIDGYSFVFRAYHSMPPMSAPDGTPVNAVYGFTNMLIRLKDKLSKQKNTQMLVTFDAGGTNFRHDIYPEYKANRPPAPEDMIPQFPLIHEVAEMLSIPCDSMAGYEADDLIATYSKLAKQQGERVTIVSSDKDLMQLIDDKTEMYDSMRNKRIGTAEVMEKFGVKPSQILDLLSLMGDASDNIPGVPSIGAKTAALLLQEYNNLEGIYSNLDNIKQNKRRETLRENEDKAYLSRKLASLNFDVPIEHSLNDLELQDYDESKLLPFLQRCGFDSIISQMGYKNTAPSVAKSNITKIDDYKTLDDITNLLKNITITGHLYFYINEDIIYLSDGINAGQISTLKQADLLNNSVVLQSDVINLMHPYLVDKSIKKITYHAKGMMGICGEISSCEDIDILNYIVHGKALKLEDISAIIPVMLQKYCTLSEAITKNKQHYIYDEIDAKLPAIVHKMQQRGVKIDINHLAKLDSEFGTQAESLSKQIYSLAGEEFNISSPKQLGEILYNKMELKGGKKLKNGGYSTNIDALEELSSQGVEIAQYIIEYRQITKLASTFCKPIIKLANNDANQRIHTSFSLTKTNTGRLSSVEPNLQNIPARTKTGKQIRYGFIAKEGHKLISADYSQIELRLLAEIGKVETLKQAFLDGQDIHSITAASVLGVSLDEVSSEQRSSAKAVNFGIIYGQSAFGLAKQLGISRTEAKQYIDAYFEKYPHIQEYMDNAIKDATTNGYVSTIMGRKIYLKDINAKNIQLKKFAERAAINAPLQGSAADIIKKAMIDVVEDVPEAKLLLQIHDELIFEVKEDIADITANKIQKTMQKVMHLSIPLLVDVSIGNNWGEL